MKKLTSLWLAFLLAIGALSGCADVNADTPAAAGGADGAETAVVAENSTEVPDLGPAVTGTETVNASVSEGEWYDSRNEVACYLMAYGSLPDNYITKDEARSLGWEGGSLEPYAAGCSIGGDRFGNYEGSLPEADGRTYTECDIDTAGANSRGAERLVFSNDGLIFYTEDHYETFTLLLGEEQD